MSYYGMKYILDQFGTGRVIKCSKCQNGKNRAGKICKYCNGTGVKTKQVGD